MLHGMLFGAINYFTLVEENLMSPRICLSLMVVDLSCLRNLRYW